MRLVDHPDGARLPFRIAEGLQVDSRDLARPEDRRMRPAEWQRYHSAFHTSSRQLGEIARQVRPKRLILYHQLFWGTTDEELVGEVRRSYAGEVVSGRDLDMY